MRSHFRRGRISFPGVIFMIIGLGLVIFEMQTGLLLNRIGTTGRIVIFVCGTGFSVWGLKEVIAGFFPGYSKTGYSFKLPQEGYLYLVIMFVFFVGSLIGRNNLLLLVFASLAGPFVMNGWFTFTMLRLLRVSRVLPERVMAGEPFTTTLILENRKTWLTIWLMTVHDAVSRGDFWFSPEVLFVRVPSSSSRQGHYQLRLKQRGAYEFGPVRITTRFPLGLVERGNRIEIIDEFLVYPRTGHLTSVWRKQLQNSTELVSGVRTMAGPFNDEMSNIREYRQGDDPRMIHWRTSARTTELMVREYEESRDRDLLLIIDGWLPQQSDPVQEENFERGLRFATTVCMEHLRSSRISSLYVRLTGEENLEWRGDQGEAHVDELLDAFSRTDGNYQIEASQLFEDLDRVKSGKRRVVIITARPEEVREALQANPEHRLQDAQIYGTSREELLPVFIDSDEVGK
ncbi:DUF58 domain-containing protein [Planctomicrobium sp.]|jgi:uncharacterized protein (DUF58 family)|nr:DUF58 domain-containing protein [Planctomicrobium sp.]MDA7527883.1 DUF58 domain-containing protein [bacterium]MDB4731884.1 DUF58 domain-containing protein [bacterium]MDB4743509.1 DUF58 domain-containing protein [Planctomicrobium sp.]